MIKPSALEQFKSHAKSMHPHEACGVIVDGELVLINNVADYPEDDFRMNPTQIPEKYDAVIHSHPSGNPEPTACDMRAQIDSGVPWAILGGEQLIWVGIRESKLVGRDFLHGVFDCYSLIRDYYHEKGIAIPDFPRDNDWWKHGENLYVENYQKAGFKRLPENAELQSGDVFLACIGSKVPNHGGIYIGNGLILHHLNKRLSRHDILGRYAKYISLWLRYGR